MISFTLGILYALSTAGILYFASKFLAQNRGQLVRSGRPGNDGTLFADNLVDAGNKHQLARAIYGRGRLLADGRMGRAFHVAASIYSPGYPGTSVFRIQAGNSLGTVGDDGRVGLRHVGWWVGLGTVDPPFVCR